MKLVAAFLVLLLVLGAPRTALGQDTLVPEPPDVPPGQDRIEPLTLRQPAPFEGMLLDHDTAIRWTFSMEWYRNELRLTLDTHRRELLVLGQSHDRELVLVRESYEREIEGLRADIRRQASTFVESNNQPWFDTFGFGLVVGVVLAGILVGLTAWVASAI